jgi:phosphohistidine phosphatase
MRLLLMRHGLAAPREEWHGDDAARPLTEAGWRKTRAAVKGLRLCEPKLDAIASSPLLRARQTAELARDEYSQQHALQIWPELEQADYSRLMTRLYETDLNATLLLVGHEPGLSRFVVRFLTNSPDRFVLDFKKAAVCALEVDYAFDTPYATLLYHLTPRQLRAMAGAP